MLALLLDRARASVGALSEGMVFSCLAVRDADIEVGLAGARPLPLRGIGGGSSLPTSFCTFERSRFAVVASTERSEACDACLLDRGDTGGSKIASLDERDLRSRGELGLDEYVLVGGEIDRVFAFGERAGGERVGGEMLR